MLTRADTVLVSISILRPLFILSKRTRHAQPSLEKHMPNRYTSRYE